MMRRLYVASFFFIFFIGGLYSTDAQSPPLGGEITYKYIGGTTSSHTYEVTLILYQKPDSSLLGQAHQVLITTSCFPDQVLNLQPYIPAGSTPGIFGGIKFPSAINCGDTLPDSLTFSIYYYRDTVNLPGTCSDFTFSYHQCCRSGKINNLTRPDTAAFHIMALLNNTVGPNTSAEFISPPRYIFCKDVEVFPNYSVYEPDGDSIYYRLEPALDSTGRPLAYEPGYNYNNPVRSYSPFSIFNFKPKRAGVCTVVMEAIEYRFNPIYGWLSIGRVIRDINFTILDSCPGSFVSTIFGGPAVVDTLYAHCGDSILSFHSDSFISNSLSADGTDFRMFGSDFLARPFIAAGTYNGSLYADSIWLRVHKPLSMNDTLTLLTKKGSDGNTLISPCGNEFPEYDVALVIVDDCQGTGLSETGPLDHISVYPNPAHNLLTIEMAENFRSATISISDLQGRKLKSLVPDSPYTILDISNFSNGIYLLDIQSGLHQKVWLIQKL